MKDGIPVPTSPADGDHLWMNIMLDIGQTDRQCQGKWVNIISYWSLILVIRHTDRWCQSRSVNIISYWPLDTLTDSVKVSGSISYHTGH